tara:strand:+ start:2179 stop:2742 length:564 start_codon:yes stop_codon:yes gene_type:complete
MYTSEQGTDKVHSLRYTFRPSEPLAERLGAFLKQDPRAIAPRFSFSSTKEHILNGEAALRNEVQVEIVRMHHAFAESVQELPLENVRYRLIGDGALQLAFLPNQVRFNDLTQLPSVLKEHQVQQERPGPGGNHLLLTTLHRDRLLGEAAVARRWIELRGEVSNPKKNALYTARTKSIDEIDMVVQKA